MKLQLFLQISCLFQNKYVSLPYTTTENLVTTPDGHLYAHQVASAGLSEGD